MDIDFSADADLGKRMSTQTATDHELIELEIRLAFFAVLSLESRIVMDHVEFPSIDVVADCRAKLFRVLSEWEKRK